MAARQMSGKGRRTEPCPAGHFRIKDGERRLCEMVPVSMRDVHRIEGAGDYVTLCTDADQVLADISLNELERRLDPACFRRVHRAHIVNLDHVGTNPALISVGIRGIVASVCPIRAALADRPPEAGPRAIPLRATVCGGAWIPVRHLRGYIRGSIALYFSMEVPTMADCKWKAAAYLTLAALMAVGPPPVAAQPPAEQQEPRLLDPLTQAERVLAVRLVTGDQRVRRFAGRRQTDASYVELLIQKPAQPGERPSRTAEVLMTAIGGEPGGVRAIVDLTSQTVLEVSRAPGVRPAFVQPGHGRQTVPISRREAEYARAVVLRDAGLRQMLRAPREGVSPEPEAPMRLEELTTEFLPITTPEELCPSGRCLEILFRRGRGYLTTRAVVELSTGVVRYRGRRQ
jgi:hypothetical protein